MAEDMDDSHASVIHDDCAKLSEGNDTITNDPNFRYFCLIHPDTNSFSYGR
jgi:hypothetical protein